MRRYDNYDYEEAFEKYIDDTEEERLEKLLKLYESLQYNTPWEMLGDTMVCRSLFYRYRSRLMYLVAVHMDMIDVSQSHDNT